METLPLSASVHQEQLVMIVMPSYHQRDIIILVIIGILNLTTKMVDICSGFHILELVLEKI